MKRLTSKKAKLRSNEKVEERVTFLHMLFLSFAKESSLRIKRHTNKRHTNHT